jgi:hypothetical protein
MWRRPYHLYLKPLWYNPNKTKAPCKILGPTRDEQGRFEFVDLTTGEIVPLHDGEVFDVKPIVKEDGR